MATGDPSSDTAPPQKSLASQDYAAGNFGSQLRQTWTLLTSKARFAPFLTPFLILLSVSLVFLIPLFNLGNSEQSGVVAIRSGVRFLFPALLSLGFLPFFFLRKFGISLLGRLEHLRLIALFRFFGFAYNFLLVLDVLLLSAYGEHISVIRPWQEALINVFLGWLVTYLMIHAYWLNALDFEGFKELSQESLQTVIPHTSTSFKLLDSIDIRILQSVERSAGELSHVLLTGESIPEAQLIARLKKLVLLKYADFYRDRHLYRFSLTPQGLDVLNLPSSLFATSIDDLEVIRKLAEVKFLLGREKNTEVVVECAKLLERILRKRIQSAEPGLTNIGGKPFDRTTLGELTGYSTRCGLIDRFEDLVLNAINNLRSQKVVHAKNQLSVGIPVDDAFFVYTLTEVCLKSLFSRIQTGMTTLDGPSAG